MCTEPDQYSHDVTWRPPHGPRTKIIAWIILVMFLIILIGAITYIIMEMA